jgi:hypothetical protein
VRVLGEEPGLGLPNQHTKACPRFQAMHCWCPSATGPGQPHQSDCVQYKRPTYPGKLSEPVHATIGSYHDWDLTDLEPIDVLQKYILAKPGKVAVAPLDDWTQAEPPAYGPWAPLGPDALMPGVVLPEVSLHALGIDVTVKPPKPPLKFIEFEAAMDTKFQTMQSIAYKTAYQWSMKQKPEAFVHVPPLPPEFTPSLVPPPPIECNCTAFEDDLGHMPDCPAYCPCAANYGVIGHAASCPLGEKAESDAAKAPQWPPVDEPKGMNGETP